MEIIKPKKLAEINDNNKKLFEQLLPELVKRLILASNTSVTNHRFPSMDEVWAPGYDGVAVCNEETKYVSKGKSVWEFGTNNNSLAKINSDYEKRTKNSLGCNKKETIFYLIVPKVWAYDCSITEWENSHTDWAAVRVYDAVILCDWINSEPDVCAWLLETIENVENVSFLTVSSAWNRFANKTNPQFTYDMFLQCREDEKEIFLKKLHSDSEDIKVKAESLIDSIGFVLSCLMQDDDLARNCIVVNNERTLNLLTSFSEDKLFFLNYKYEGELKKNNNRVIMCFNKEATSISETIDLPLLTKTAYQAALKKMGIPDGEITDLFAFTHGNLRALIRRKPGNIIECQPDWAKSESLDLLVPLVLLRSINKEKDSMLVEKLTDKSFTEVEKTYHNLSMLEDSPVKIVHNHFVIVNYEEAWATLGLTPLEYHFDKLSKLLLEMLDEINLKGKYFDRYLGEYKSVFKRLIWNLIYYSYEEEGVDKLRALIYEILNRSNGDAGRSLILDNISMLATAYPEGVMDFMNDIFYQPNSWIKELFIKEDYDRSYCDVLWALDELAIHQETFSDACKMLFELLLMNKEYKISNSPEESLLVALCLWRCEGTTTIAQKELTLKKMLTKNSRHAIEIGAKLIRKNSYMKGVRIGEKRIQGEALTVKTIMETKERIMDLLFQKTMEIHDAEILTSLISNYNFVSADLIDKYADEFKIEEYEREEVNDLNYWLRDKVFNIIRFSWDDKETYIAALKKWITCSTYADKLLSCHWVFRKSYDCPANELLESVDDYLVDDQARYTYRKQVLDALLTQYSDDAIKSILMWISDEHWWGMFLATELPKESFSVVATSLFESKKYNVLSQYLDESDEDKAKEFLKLIGEGRNELLRKISNSNLLDVFGEEEKIIFWKSREMFRYSEFEYKQLLKYNPSGLITYIYLECAKDAENINIVFEVFERLCDSEICVNRNLIDEIKTIIGRIDQIFYSESWAELCIKLESKMNIVEYPECVCRLIFEHPEMISKYIDADGRVDYQFRKYFSLPKVAYSEYFLFKSFFDAVKQIEVKSEVKYSMIGDILGRTDEGSDGWFPHEFTRQILEDYDDRQLDIEVACSYDNLHSFRTITDGHDQKVLYAKYMRKANELMLDYPHTSFVLKKVSRLYEANAKRDFIHSELIDY